MELTHQRYEISISWRVKRGIPLFNEPIGSGSKRQLNAGNIGWVVKSFLEYVPTCKIIES